MFDKLSSLLTIWLTVIVFDTGFSIAEGQSACVADLARVQSGFCVAEGQKAGMSYQWGLTAGQFDLMLDSCFTSGSGSEQDIILAVDRSQAMSECPTGKLGSPIESFAYYLLDALRKRAASAGKGFAPRMGLIFFSSAHDCVELNANDPSIDYDNEFPCRVVPMGNPADDQHYNRIRDAIDESRGLYSRDGLTAGADFTIVTEALDKDLFKVEADRPAGVVLLTNGRPYQPQAQSEYAYLHVDNYHRAEQAALAAFASSTGRKHSLSIGLIPHTAPYFGADHVSAYETMCASEPGAEDCAQGVSVTDPSTWPVNKIDPQAVATRLVQGNGGSAEDVVLLDSRSALTALGERARLSHGSVVPLDSASLNLNGQSVPGKVSAESAVFTPLAGPEAIDQSSELSGELVLVVRGAEQKIPIKVSLTRKPPEPNGVFQDKEMLCRADAALVEGPNNQLGRIQGGSGSCGVVGMAIDQSTQDAIDRTTTVLFLAPIILMLLLGRVWLRFSKTLLFVAGVAALLNANQSASAEGINVLNFGSRDDGIGFTSNATPIRQGLYPMSLFLDYASHPLEIENPDGKTRHTIVDGMITSQIGVGTGISDDIDAQVTLPIVWTSKIDHRENGAVHQGGASGIADMVLTSRYHLVRDPDYDFALMPVLQLPTGSQSSFTSDGVTSLGVFGLFSGRSRAISWTMNLGYTQPLKKKRLIDDRAANTVSLSGHLSTLVGVAYHVDPQWIMETSIGLKQTPAAGFGLNASNPSEWQLGLRYWHDRRLAMFGGIGTGLGKGYGGPDFRITAGLTYLIGQ